MKYFEALFIVCSGQPLLIKAALIDFWTTLGRATGRALKTHGV